MIVVGYLHTLRWCSRALSMWSPVLNSKEDSVTCCAVDLTQPNFFTPIATFAPPPRHRILALTIHNSNVRVQLAFWDSSTLAVALSRGRIQLRDVSPGRKASTSSVVSTTSSCLSATPVTADWIAHCGPVTCMATRPTPTPTPVGGAGTSNSSSSGNTPKRRHNNTKTGRASVGRPGSLDHGGSWTASARKLFARLPVLVTGGGDGMVKVWTDEGRAGGEDDQSSLGDDFSLGNGYSNGNSIGGSSNGHEGAVLSVCWHPGGEMLASAGQDWAIWLWDAEGRAISYVHAHRRWTQALTFSPAGDLLVSCAGVGGFEGWVVKNGGRVTNEDETQNQNQNQYDQVATLSWRQPQRLVATMAEVSETTRDTGTRHYGNYCIFSLATLPPTLPPSHDLELCSCVQNAHKIPVFPRFHCPALLAHAVCLV